MNDQFAVTTDALTKEYGETTAVADLDLVIASGSIYGFLGPNGAGKTTTIRMLTALTHSTSGTGHVAGQPITDRQAVIQHIGYLPESPPSTTNSPPANSSNTTAASAIWSHPTSRSGARSCSTDSI
jgi:ABC-2 type transport system ATP-binding protein